MGSQVLRSLRRLERLNLHLHGAMGAADASAMAAVLGQLPRLQHLHLRYSAGSGGGGKGAAAEGPASAGGPAQRLPPVAFAGLRGLRSLVLSGDFCGGEGVAARMAADEPYRRVALEVGG